MAAFSYESLKKKYDNFMIPMIDIEIDGNNLRGNKKGLGVTNIVVDITCGFEANQATFDLINCYDPEKSCFKFDALKKYVILGSAVIIRSGYNHLVREIFRGIICKCDFTFEEGDTPHVTVTAMDVKAVMMANHYHKQLLSSDYSGAVFEIFSQTLYMTLKANQVITEIDIEDTPEGGAADLLGDVGGDMPGGDMVGDAVSSAADAAQGAAKKAASAAAEKAMNAATTAVAEALKTALESATGIDLNALSTVASSIEAAQTAVDTVKKAKEAATVAQQAALTAKQTGGAAAKVAESMKTDKTIEMVGESDYEFVVKAAKKFGFEFYCLGGSIFFRKAKSDTVELFDLNNHTGIKRLNVSYDITGIVGAVEVRGINAGTGKMIKKRMKNTNKLSQGSKAKSIVSDSKYVYVDPTVNAASDASGRATYLLDDMSYRLGSLELVMQGLPEMVPGRFIRLSEFGTAVSNQFYVTAVQHRMLEDGTYEMKVTGKAAKMESAMPGL